MARKYLSKMYSINDGSRSLFESIAIPEVEQALKDWIKHSKSGVLIGGAAMGYYGKPRSTFDIDLLFVYPTDIPIHVEGFKRIRPGAFQHNQTHVEVEVISPQAIQAISHELAMKVIETANFTDGVRVATPSAIVALKLQRMKKNDIGDIVQMIETGEVDLSDFPLSDRNLADYEEIKQRFV
jgi:hypothetical protein